MKTFPIQGGWSRTKHKEIPPMTIPWDMIAPHEAQALKNHAGQSLKRLAERGGLSHCEAIAVLEDRPWHRLGIDPIEAYEMLVFQVQAWEKQHSETVTLTTSQRMALITILTEYMRLPDHTEEFVDCSQPDAPTTTVSDLLRLLMPS